MRCCRSAPLLRGLLPASFASLLVRPRRSAYKRPNAFSSNEYLSAALLSAQSHGCGGGMNRGRVCSSSQCLRLSFSNRHAHAQARPWLIFLSQASGSLDIPRSISLKTDTHPISLVQQCHAIPVDIIQKVSQGPFHCGATSRAGKVSHDSSISNRKVSSVIAVQNPNRKRSPCGQNPAAALGFLNANNAQNSFDSIIGYLVLRLKPSDLTAPLPRSEPTSISSPPHPRGPLSGPLPLCITSIRPSC